ncbi:MAG: excinuclease ABC subunit UvrB [Candidatus Neomarinimicrobiota bacterium]
MSEFKIDSKFNPTGDQPKAIKELVDGVNNGDKYQTLLGVTGSGKTFTIANVIQEVQKPTLIMSHNKTLAAQLYSEFKLLFPNNAVEFFISYYDYYQPEAYMPVTDTLIDKEATINEEIDKLRLKTTSSLMSREDVIVVSSVSSIYGLGSPENYIDGSVSLSIEENLDRRGLLTKLINIHYLRNDHVLERGNIRVRGDIIEIYPAYEDCCFRIELYDDKIESIFSFDPISGEVLEGLNKITVFPAKHFITKKETLKRVISEVREELTERLDFFNKSNKFLEAQRIEQRTNFDIEMMIELGYCSGIENYSRIFANRKPGETPHTLQDFFPKNSLTILDESHVTLPQIQGMYNGDRARKMTLVEHGFRLPSALDNRPLKYDEFFKAQKQIIFTSATPSHRELDLCKGAFVEQIIRPTGLLDPIVKIKKTEGQIDDLVQEIRTRVKVKERVLVTTLTKRMAEDLTDYLKNLNILVKYLHSDIDTIKRVEIIRDLRLGTFDVLVGINLLREGLDLPEVSLVAVLDSDKEGFLRSKSSLLQTAGRAARHVKGMVILYGDKQTDAIKNLIEITVERRKIQEKYNQANKIEPKTISKTIDNIKFVNNKKNENKVDFTDDILEKLELENSNSKSNIKNLEKLMLKASDELKFEKAAELRDRIRFIKAKSIE